VLLLLLLMLLSYVVSLMVCLTCDFSCLGSNVARQILPSGRTAIDNEKAMAVSAATTLASMPPPPPAGLASNVSAYGQVTTIPSPPHKPQANLAPQPSLMEGVRNEEGPFKGVVEVKKQQKRAANRRSAQLSRKRKKLYIEDLKEENDELRRKEQILRSIPDLIVVFDSVGL
jgi:Basic region leucine zipper